MAVDSGDWTGKSDDYGISHPTAAEVQNRKFEAMKIMAQSGLLSSKDFTSAMNSAYQNALGAHPFAPAQAVSNSGYSPMQKLYMRLNMKPSDDPWDYLNAVDNPKGENVVVFLIKDGKPLTFEDERGMFPTDSLVGKLNLLR